MFFRLLCTAGIAMPVIALADGGVVIAREELDGMVATVFASPAPLRAGPVDVSVMLQKAGTNEAVLDTAVQVAWVPPKEGAAGLEWLPPCCSMDAAEGWQPATRGHSQNKMLYSAFVPIKSAGPSQLAFRIAGGEQMQEFVVNLQVGPPASPMTAYWMWLAFPPVAIVAFGVHQKLSRSRE